MSPEGDRPAVGLRQRKKAKVRAAIQHHALRLFREQGYEETTVEQIAEAAEVSPSTFFRYFPTKQDVVLYDVLDPVIISSFRAQPAGLSPLESFRRALREVYAGLSAEDLAQQRERAALFLSTPELRARVLEELARTIQVVANLVAERVGRRPDDFAVRSFAGALMGVVGAAALAVADDPTADPLALMESAIANLEAGLPL